MSICQRCQANFTPPSPDCDKLCSTCVEEILLSRRLESPNDEEESTLILREVADSLTVDSNIESLLSSPGVGLAIARLIATSSTDPTMLGLNCFRVGAYLAFKQAKVDSILNR